MDRAESDPEHVRWAKAVRIRDMETCQICGLWGGDLNAHHKNCYHEFPDQRYWMSNGVLLCERCHRAFHERYGYVGVTEKQFKEFEIICELLIKILEKKNV